MKRIVVKIGSNVLTRKDGTLDITRMSAITDQVATLTKKGLELIVVSSGAVASGRSEINPGKDLDDVSSRQLFSAVGQVKLINRYYDLFRCHGLVCGQVLTTKDSLSRPGQYENQQHCIEVMLSNGVVPIINENDTISLTELMFTDNDELSGTMARMMKADMLLILSNINGLADSSRGSRGVRNGSLGVHQRHKVFRRPRGYEDQVWSRPPACLRRHTCRDC